MDTVAGVAVGPLKELEVVDDNHANIVVVGGAASLVAELEDGHGAGVVNIEAGLHSFRRGVTDAGEVFVGEIASANFPGVNAGDIRNHAVDDFVVPHFHRVEEDAFCLRRFGWRRLCQSEVLGEGSFTHGWAAPMMMRSPFWKPTVYCRGRGSRS